MVAVEIIAVGNELLLGDVLDTNTNWLCKKITGLGGQVKRTAIIGDDLEAIAHEIRSALARKADVIFTTGGLGPTADDMTLEGIARATASPLELNDEALAFVKAKYEELAKKGYVEDAAMTEARRKMAFLPRGARAISNPVGAAPASVLKANSSLIISLPGVPAELKGIFEGPLQPILKEIFGESVFIEKLLVVGCRDESLLAPMLKEIAEENPKVYVKSRAKTFGPQVKFRITISMAGSDRGEVERAINKALGDLRRALDTAHIPIESIE